MSRVTFLLLLGSYIVAPGSYAQQGLPVMDLMLKDSIGENATRNGKQAGLLTVIRRMTKNTKDDVEATQQLQSSYREFLKQTGSTASLALMDNEAEREGVGQVANASGRLGAYSFADDLYEVYQQQAEPMDKSQALYERLIPFDETLVFTDLSSLEAYRKARQLNVTALEEMSQRRKLQLAQAYRQFAQRAIEKVSELQELLTGDEQFSMTEAERLETLGRMQDYLLRSQQLQAKADELIGQTVTPSFQKGQALNAFRQQQERKVLADTPLFQD